MCFTLPKGKASKKSMAQLLEEAGDPARMERIISNALRKAAPGIDAYAQARRGAASNPRVMFKVIG
jgi:hypothetical protein